MLVGWKSHYKYSPVGLQYALSLVVSEAYRSDCFVFILEGMLNYSK